VYFFHFWWFIILFLPKIGIISGMKIIPHQTPKLAKNCDPSKMPFI